LAFTRLFLVGSTHTTSLKRGVTENSLNVLRDHIGFQIHLITGLQL
jgi:hypothetical protein